jgi:hypothetical protein
MCRKLAQKCVANNGTTHITYPELTKLHRFTMPKQLEHWQLMGEIHLWGNTKVGWLLFYYERVKFIQPLVMGKFKNSCCKNKTKNYLCEYKTSQSVAVSGYCRDNFPVAAVHGKKNVMYGQEHSIVTWAMQSTEALSWSLFKVCIYCLMLQITCSIWIRVSFIGWSVHTRSELHQWSQNWRYCYFDFLDIAHSSTYKWNFLSL